MTQDAHGGKTDAPVGMALLILSSREADDQDWRMREDMVRQGMPSLDVKTFVVSTSAEVEAAAGWAALHAAHVAWNCYWHDDDLARLIAKRFRDRLVGFHTGISRSAGERRSGSADVGTRRFAIAYGGHLAYRPLDVTRPGVAQYSADPALDRRLRNAADLMARQCRLGPWDHGVVHLREKPETEELVLEDIECACSVAPDSLFALSLAGNGVPRQRIVAWLTAPLGFHELARDTVIYLPFHTNLSQVENLLPFIRAFHCKVFLYEWADSSDYMFRYFSEVLGVEAHFFDVDRFVALLEQETGSVIVMLTEALSYNFGKCQKHFFELAQQCYPQIIDVLSIGHCLEHSGCDACKSDVGDIPIKYTAYRGRLLPYDANSVSAAYRLTPKTVLVSPTTGGDDIILARLDLLQAMKALQDEGEFQFLFKLHPSTEMMAFDGTHFVQEEIGYAYVRRHFQMVAKEHFSVLPFAEAIKIHIVDLWSSIPAMLTYFGDCTLLAKDSRHVDRAHPLRPYLDVFDTAAQLRSLLRDATRPPPTNGAFWRAHYHPVTGDEPAAIAFARDWRRKAQQVRGPAGSPAAFRNALQRHLDHGRQQFQCGEIDQDSYDDLVFYFEKPLGGTRLLTQAGK